MRKGGFSFVDRGGLFGKGEEGETFVVPGEPDKSGLIRRIRSRDEEERMPPPKSNHPPLVEDDRVLLERWIREGAAWELPWAWQKPVKPTVPSSSSTWPKAGLDHFVLAKLESAGLSPSREANLAEWFRRVSLDLTGLPATGADWEKLKNAAVIDREKAMGEAVDRLLASPAFGERWVSVWLDLARYADTTGYERDPHRDIWPFRDWVIRAFNSDMPFDEFTVKQLAGDLLEHPDPGDLAATAFHRNTQTNTEAGSNDEEFRVAAVIDRVNTTWTAWQGTTFACAQCHDHPSDPIRQHDYYRFMAIFNNTEDCDLDADFPFSKVTADPARQGESEQLERSIRESRISLNTVAKTVAAGLRDWQPWKGGTATSNSPEGILSERPGAIFEISGTFEARAVYTLSGPARPFAVLKLDVLPDSDNLAERKETGAVVSKLEVTVVKPDGERKPVAFREVVADFLAGPFEPNESLVDGSEGFGGYPTLTGPRTAWFVPAEPVVTGDGDLLEIHLLHGAMCNGGAQACLLRRFKLALSTDRTLLEKLASHERAEDWARHAKLVREYGAIEGTTLPVMRERESSARRETQVFSRGNRLVKGETVSAGLPTGFSTLEGGGINSRLTMAEWLVGESNPLAARVMANRLWSELFGKGVVESQEDFGSAGMRPSNQDLLDYLALDLRVKQRWHIKPFLRGIVLSSTYRQTGDVNPDTLAKDAENRLLSRGPRQRLTAEMIRDQGLFVAGLLSPEMAGPPVFPPQPEGVWRTVNSSARWINSVGPNRYRRAIYTYTKRTSGYPPLLAFDVPSRDVCSARRIPTNTPLQALATLNDPAYQEFARAMARHMMASAESPEDRINVAHRLLFLENAPQPVVGILSRLYADVLTVSGGTKQAEEDAWTTVASTLLNSDQALTR